MVTSCIYHDAAAAAAAEVIWCRCVCWGPLFTFWPPLHYFGHNFHHTAPIELKLSASWRYSAEVCWHISMWYKKTLLTKIQGSKVDASRVTKRHSTTTTAAAAFVVDRCPIPNVHAFGASWWSRTVYIMMLLLLMRWYDDAGVCSQ